MKYVTCVFSILANAAFAHSSFTQTTDKFYFWVDGIEQRESGFQSFVVEVDANMKAQIEAEWSKGDLTPRFRAHIAAGSVSYNKNYSSATHAVWNWHVVSVDAIDNLFSPFAPPDPTTDADPSDIAVNPNQWIQNNGDVIHLKNYYFKSQIDPTQSDTVANVSNRGRTGSGENVLISGFIVKGGEPRNIVIRGLGPSLTANGVQQAAGNPKIDIYQGSQKIATNTDWKTDRRVQELTQNYPSLQPSNDKEAALLLTLLPGAYTVQGINEDGTDGIMVLEVYDVDANLN